MRIQNLGESLERFVQDQVTSGRYATPDDVIRTALHLLQDQEHEIASSWTVEELRREVQKGIDSGPGIPAEEVFARLDENIGAWSCPKTNEWP